MEENSGNSRQASDTAGLIGEYEEANFLIGPVEQSFLAHLPASFMFCGARLSQGVVGMRVPRPHGSGAATSSCE
jgi:hypothetical protein